MNIVQLSYATTGAVFGILALIMVWQWKSQSIHPLLLLATVLTSAWGIIISLSATAPILGNLLSASETIKTAAWILFLSSLLFQYWRQANSMNYTFVLSMVMAFLFTLQLFIDFGALKFFNLDIQASGLRGLYVQAYIFGRLVVSIAGLALMENLYRSTEKTEKWKLRPLGLAIGGMYAYDILLYAEGLLFTSIDPDLFGARGFITAMAAPLIYLSFKRVKRWTFDVVLSRRAVFHSLSLLVTGFYLIFMAAAGWGLRQFGGSWGAVLQIAFICAAGGFLLYLFVSDGARARARVLLAKYFRRYKYDYRDVWIKFIRRIDAHDGEGGLQARVIDGVSEIVDSQGGRLYLKDPDGRFVLAEARNFRSEFFSDEPAGSSFLKFLETTRWIVDLNEVRAGDMRYEDLNVPSWVEDESQAWLVIPLIRDELVGYIVTRQPRARRALDWEDHDLLKTIGMQAASYMAEQKSQAALSEAEQFDAFNRRFAFIMHDLKNLVSQLSLLSHNVERHGADPEFQKDMAETLESSVSKINALLARLHQAPDKVQNLQSLDVSVIAAEVVRQKQRAHDALVYNVPDKPIFADVDGEKLEQVLTHLLQNAIDASDASDTIELVVQAKEDQVRIDVCDTGAGMTADFVQTQLFKPFASTKEAGFGIGAYEARELTQQMGGRLAVVSDIGKGTCFTLFFANVLSDDAALKGPVSA